MGAFEELSTLSDPGLRAVLQRALDDLRETRDDVDAIDTVLVAWECSSVINGTVNADRAAAADAELDKQAKAIVARMPEGLSPRWRRYARANLHSSSPAALGLRVSVPASGSSRRSWASVNRERRSWGRVDSLPPGRGYRRPLIAAGQKGS